MPDYRLVAFEAHHLPLYARWNHDPEVIRWLDLGCTLEEWYAYITSSDISDAFIFMEDDMPVGHLQVDRLEGDPAQAQVSLLIAPEARGRGLAALLLNVLHATGDMKDIRRFFAFVEPRHSASIAALKRAQYMPAPSQDAPPGYVVYEWRRPC
jgi:RimJ/RimL family protein N-acetyltransferase